MPDGMWELLQMGDEGRSFWVILCLIVGVVLFVGSV